MKTIRLNTNPKTNPKTNPSPDPSPDPSPKPEQTATGPVKPVKVKRQPKEAPVPGFTPPTKPADPGPVSLGSDRKPKPSTKRKGPNVLAVKKLAAELAYRFLPRKYARTTTGSDVQVSVGLFRAVGGYGTPNLLNAYRKARDGAKGFVWDLSPEHLHPFGVVSVDQVDGRPVAVVDAEFLFRLFGEVGAEMVAKVWAACGQPKA